MNKFVQKLMKKHTQQHFQAISPNLLDLKTQVFSQVALKKSCTSPAVSNVLSLF